MAPMTRRRKLDEKKSEATTNTNPDTWTFNGAQYDLASFAENHPGGKWVIKESQGFDVTYMIQCNHRWTEQQAVERLKKYKVRDNKPGVGVQWDAKLTSMQQELKKGGFDVFRAKTPLLGVVYYTIMALIYAYFAFLWSKTPTWSNSLIFGALGWLWGGFIQHEGGHAALSRNPTVNFLGRYAIFPWASLDRWFVKHTVLHHQFTNTKQDMDFQTAADAPVR